jgi:hypothetical protein
MLAISDGVPKMAPMNPVMAAVKASTGGDIEILFALACSLMVSYNPIRTDPYVTVGELVHEW